VNNTEIRLHILFGCYSETYHGQQPFEYEYSLKGVKRSVMMANMAYLIDKGLVNGGVDEFPDGSLYAETGRILPAGVDIVEKITSRSVERLDEPIASEIRDSPNRQLAFWEKCVNVTKTCGVAVEVAGQIFEAIA